MTMEHMLCNKERKIWQNISFLNWVCSLMLLSLVMVWWVGVHDHCHSIFVFYPDFYMLRTRGGAIPVSFFLHVYELKMCTMHLWESSWSSFIHVWTSTSLKPKPVSEVLLWQEKKEFALLLFETADNHTLASFFQKDFAPTSYLGSII